MGPFDSHELLKFAHHSIQIFQKSLWRGQPNEYIELRVSEGEKNDSFRRLNLKGRLTYFAIGPPWLTFAYEQKYHEANQLNCCRSNRLSRGRVDQIGFQPRCPRGHYWPTIAFEGWVDNSMSLWPNK